LNRPSAGTRVLALLGRRVGHSLSPDFQNAGIRAARLDGIYVALACEEADLPGLLLGIARAGGGGNITVPYKEVAARLLERSTEAVERTSACNTFWLEDRRVYGDNTDVHGVREACRALLGTSSRDARVLLLGAGGVARAALLALELDGADEVTLLNRTGHRGRAAADSWRGRRAVRVATDPGDLRGERFDLVINATPLGLSVTDPLPLAAGDGVEIGAALDLVYSPGETPWVLTMRASGIPAADGMEMLLQQGIAAFRRWWDGEPPVQAMRAALPMRP
jgi:shikimate dehydrogenase